MAKSIAKSLLVKTADEADFFARGKRIAKLADKGQALPQEHVVSFEDPADLLRMLTAGKLELFKAVRLQADSITGIAARLHRDRSAVKRDVDQLAAMGMITVEDQALPGHGRMKFVRAVAQKFRLEAQLA